MLRNVIFYWTVYFNVILIDMCKLILVLFHPVIKQTVNKHINKKDNTNKEDIFQVVNLNLTYNVMTSHCQTFVRFGV